MNLLEELDGLRGENLASAVLRFLVLQSSPCKNALLQTLNAVSPIGPLTSTSHFSCYRERATSSEESGPGRIDLVLELDQAVIGIEAKLLAEFQPDQPTKYRKDIERLCKGLADIRRHKMQWLLVVLGPRSRSEEIRREIAGRDHEVFLSWEDVLDAIEKRKDDLDRHAEVVFKDLKEFVEERATFLPKFRDWLPHLRNQWEVGGTPLQRWFVQRIRSILPNAGRLGAGETWVGYYFKPDPDDPIGGWIGFFSGARTVHPTRGAVLVISIDRKPPESEFVRPIELNPPCTIDRVNVPSWEIKFDEEWSSREVWKKRLQVFLSPCEPEQT